MQKWLHLSLLLLAVVAFACSSGGNHHSGHAAIDDDDNDDNDDNDNDNDNDDASPDDDDDASPDDDDDDNDDNSPFQPWVNPDAKADAFKLYYKERLARILPAYNRFMLVGDVVPAHTLGATAVAKSGSNYEVVLHPVDNNDIGWTAFNVYQGYKVFGTRDQALTLIRQFEGLAVVEQVEGIPGLTCREWEPGFITQIDGTTGAITRTHAGAPATPAVSYPSSLETEIINTFFNDGVYTIDADPTDYYFRTEPILNTGTYAVTEVFTEMPNYLRDSDCCSSFMVSKLGTYTGYFWGNHNSRDNFADFAMGYIAACQAANDSTIDSDVRASAAKACASGKRIGDSVVQNGYNLMTVGEFQPYDAQHLIVAGSIRPDGSNPSLEWLGSMDMCQMSYMAKALSTAGLTSPNEVVDTPGAYEIQAIDYIFQLLNLPLPKITKHCYNLDDLFVGISWGKLLNMDILGTPVWDLVKDALNLDPSAVYPVLFQLTGAVQQPEASTVAIIYYARLDPSKTELMIAAQNTLYHITEIVRRVSQMAYDWAKAQNPPNTSVMNQAQQNLQTNTLWANLGGVGNNDYNTFGYQDQEAFQEGFEAVLTRPDSTPWPLVDDTTIWQEIQNAYNGSDSIDQQRYTARFPTQADMPFRADGNGYDAIGLDGNFHTIPNVTNQWVGGLQLWMALPYCELQPTVLDCKWALLGCARPDLNGDGKVDAADQTLFNTAWATYGPPNNVPCNAGNNWCDGADLDHSGLVDTDDQAFMAAAQGCWY